VEDKFYNKAEQYFKSIIEDDLIVDQVKKDHITSPLSILESNNNNPKEMEVQ